MILANFLYIIDKNCNFFRKSVTIYVKDILKRRFKSKVEKRETTLREYSRENRLDIDKVVEDYYGYIYGKIIG